MIDFVWLIWDLFSGIFNKFQDVLIPFTNNRVTTLGSILFACLVIGFVASLYWKGAKAQ